VTALRLAAALPSRLAVPQVRPSPAGPALSPVVTPEVREWQAEIQAWSAEHALPAALIATVMQIESCGDARALSSAGAQGLFQVMPFHFQPGESAGDPHTNARRGLTYFSQALRLSQGRIDLALAGYNGGLSRIQQAPEAWPAETRRYVAWGAGIYADAQAGRTSSPTLEAWLAAGGASLCRAAAQPS
jgi:soluble lytic murein transglycosylase-like protein